MFSMIFCLFNLVAFIFIAGAISKATSVFIAMHKCFMNILIAICACIDETELQLTTIYMHVWIMIGVEGFST